MIELSNSIISISSRQGLIKKFNDASPSVRSYFDHLNPCFNALLSYDLMLAYVFQKTEEAHHRALYGALVKLHLLDKAIVGQVLDRQHFTRDGFTSLCKTTLGKEVPNVVSNYLQAAEKVRDKMIHGKRVNPSEVRNAIANVLEYAELFNQFVYDIARFKPFGSMKGFKGKSSILDKRTSRWVLKGMGYSIS